MIWRVGKSPGGSSCDTNGSVQREWSSFGSIAGLAKKDARALKKEAFQAASRVSSGKNGWTKTSNKQCSSRAMTATGGDGLSSDCSLVARVSGNCYLLIHG